MSVYLLFQMVGKTQKTRAYTLVFFYYLGDVWHCDIPLIHGCPWQFDRSRLSILAYILVILNNFHLNFVPIMSIREMLQPVSFPVIALHYYHHVFLLYLISCSLNELKLLTYFNTVCVCVCPIRGLNSKNRTGFIIHSNY